MKKKRARDAGNRRDDKESDEREELRKAWAIWWTATDKDMDKNLAVWRGLYCRK
jgi:hypothetical protein